MWDGGSTLSFITFRKAKELQLRGKPVTLRMVVVGAETKIIESEIYKIRLIDNKGNLIEIEVLGIDRISTPVNAIDLSCIKGLFQVKAEDYKRPDGKEIDILIGMQYAGYHPVRIEAAGHLLLLRNCFGYVIAGHHSQLKEGTKVFVKHATVLNATGILDQIEKFYSMEQLGISCTPKCGSCKCGNCHPGGKDMTLKEEKELSYIQECVTFNQDSGRWIAKYPWIMDPALLPNNRCLAYATLKSTEKRLFRNLEHAQLYKRQIEDMIDRKAARIVTNAELEEYQGPKFYIAHHAVMKPESKSTPCRIVFNSSSKFYGKSLNDFLAKGPSLLNNMLGILLRFRQNQVAFIGDIKKMFHSIEIPNEDQMTHLFLWRDLDITKEPTTYAITRVNMGDRPSSAIAQTALRKTAENAMIEFPEAAKVVLRNCYMDDIPASVTDRVKAIQIMGDISSMLQKKGFQIKEWIWSGSKSNSPSSKTPQDQRAVQLLLKLSGDTEISEKVLGMNWDVNSDELVFNVKLSDSLPLFNQPTKRSILSSICSIYDPLGLLTPVTIRAKILLRKIWATKPSIGWDEALPQDICREWISIHDDLQLVDKIRFKRSLTPKAAKNAPSLIIFSDGSIQAYGAVAYCRWEVAGGFESRLITAKARIAPVKIIDIVRLELCGAVIGSRLRSFVEKDMDIRFEKCFHIVDSEIVKAMVGKESYGFNTFAANRVGEIQRCTKLEEWYWTSGESNAADITTRGCSAHQLIDNIDWQYGPKFLSLPEEQWPIKAEVSVVKVPEMKGIVNIAGVKMETLASRIDLNRFSKWALLLHTTARILNLYKGFKKGSSKTLSEVLPVDLEAAETFWVKEAQKQFHGKLDSPQYRKLCPRVDEKGIVIVGGRTERWMNATWNRQEFILLPKDSRISLLIIRHIHNESRHLGSASTIAKVRAKFWIIGLCRMANSMSKKCVICQIKFKRLLEQRMSTLPIERLKPSPPFFYICVDYFGPFTIKGEVQKRVRGKGYGVIFTCLTSRAIHLELASNYSTDGFLQVLRKFASIRGWPRKLFSDQGSQLKGASKELQDTVRNLSWDEIKKYGHEHGTEWSFSPGDAPWYNGTAESLIKTVKGALLTAVGEQIMSFSELQTCLYEAAQLVNQRPIGIKFIGQNQTYLSPNDLLLGRASPNVPQGPFKERASNAHRFDFLQQIVGAFWKRWTREIFPSLVLQPKWHVDQRNLKQGDVVLIQDTNAVRGEWRKGIVFKTIPSKDNRIRRVIVEYDSGGTKIHVERAVQRLILLVPVDQPDAESVQCHSSIAGIADNHMKKSATEVEAGTA